MGLYIALALLVFLLLIFVMAAVTMVKQGYVYTIERFGKFTKAADPGLTIIFPLIDRVGHRINMMEQVLDIPGQEIITKDNAMVGVDAVVFFQVLDAPKAAYEVSGLNNAIMALTTTNLRTVMGSMDLERRVTRPPPSCAQKAPSSPPSSKPRASAKPPSAMPRRASVRPKPKPRRRSSCPTRSPATASRQSTTSSRRNTPRRWASSPTAPMPRPSCSRSRRPS